MLTNWLRELPAGNLWPPGSPPGLPPVVPSYLRGPNMDTLLGACGLQADCLAEQVMWGRLQGFPSAGPPGGPISYLADGRLIQCEPWVLPVLAAQRGITLYSTEGEQSARYRLANYLPLHRQRGTHLGEFLHARPYFFDFVYDPVTGAPTGNAFPGIDCVFQTGDEQAVWHRMSSAGAYSIYRPAVGNFNWDGRTSYRTRSFYFVRMAGTGFTPPITWDDGVDTWNSGAAYWDQGGSVPFTWQRMSDVASMLIDWTSEHAWVNLVAFVWDPAAVDPTTQPVQSSDGTWSLPNAKWSGPIDPSTGLATRPPGVDFFYVSNAP